MEVGLTARIMTNDKRGAAGAAAQNQGRRPREEERNYVQALPNIFGFFPSFLKSPVLLRCALGSG